MKNHLSSRWQGAVLVCAKCSKRVGGGFGDKGRTPLAKALRRHLGLRKGRRAALGVVEVKCLGACPKGAVVAVDAARPDRWWLVRPGTDMAEVAALLRPPRQGEPDRKQTGAGAVAGLHPAADPDDVVPTPS